MRAIRWTRFHVRPEHRRVLEEAGLSAFEPLMLSPLGDVVSAEDGREVRHLRLDREGKTLSLFIKRDRTSPRLSWVLKGMLRGRLPKGIPQREYEAVVRLQEGGLPVMEPVAWGARSLLGIPREGFLVVRAVEGESAATLWAEASRRVRERFMQELGAFVGELNAKGFYSKARLKDLICKPASEASSRGFGFVLIDRQCAPYEPQKFALNHCLRCLAQSFVSFAATGDYPTRREAIRFARAYVASLPPVADVSVRALLKALPASLKREPYWPSVPDDYKVLVDQRPDVSGQADRAPRQ